MDYKSILLSYISKADATTGSVVYQPCDGLIEVCQTISVKQDLINLVQDSTISLLTNKEDSAYEDLIQWSQDTDLLLLASNNVLFCIPKLVA